MHGLESISHETKPPARFTEATLVKELEKRGVGGQVRTHRLSVPFRTAGMRKATAKR